MVTDNNKTDKTAKYIRQLERESKQARLSKSSSRPSSRRQSHESSSRRHGSGDSTRSLPTDGLIAKNQHSETSGVATTTSTASQDFTSPRKSRSRRRINDEAPGVHSTSRSSRIRRREERHPDRRAIKSGSRKENGKRRKVDEMMTVSVIRTSEDTSPSHSTSDSIDRNSSDEEQTPAVLTSGVARATNSREIERENYDKNNKSRRKKSETANIRATENSSRNLRIVRLLSCITVIVLIVIGVVAYFVATRTSESRTPEASYPPTVRLSTSFPRTPNPSTSPPSSSPTLPFHFDPPLQEDCDRVRAGEVDPGQDSAEHSFDVTLDVIMGIQFGQSETMDLLELEIQTLLMPQLIGCGEVRNRELTHQRMLRNNPYRYIVANAKIQWRPSSLEENADCSHPMCLSATFNMDLFLKTEDDDYFVIMNLVADVFGGNLVDSLNLQSLPFISVVVRSVINKNPTMAPSTLPSSIPSTSPSREPTEIPSKLPSLAPTETPTQKPTVSPTSGPSLRPTVAPTTRPPTAPPTPQPTRRPTPVPTHSPTAAPSKSPSAHPSTSINPTGEMDGYFQQLDHPIRIACAGDSLTPLCSHRVCRTDGGEGGGVSPQTL